MIAPLAVLPLLPQISHLNTSFCQRLLSEQDPFCDHQNQVFVVCSSNNQHHLSSHFIAIPELLRMSSSHLVLLILPAGNLFCFMFSWSPGLPPADWRTCDFCDLCCHNRSQKDPKHKIPLAVQAVAQQLSFRQGAVALSWRVRKACGWRPIPLTSPKQPLKQMNSPFKMAS